MVVEAFVAVYYIFGLITIFAIVKGKGYGVLLAVIATIIAAFTSPIIIFLICLFLIPTEKGSYWDKN